MSEPFAPDRTLYPFESRWFQSSVGQIHYLDEGEGEPVLLIHGYTASATLNWGIPGILKNLAVDHRVIALDNRGHGRSDHNDGDPSSRPIMHRQ